MQSFTIFHKNKRKWKPKLAWIRHAKYFWILIVVLVLTVKIGVFSIITFYSLMKSFKKWRWRQKYSTSNLHHSHFWNDFIFTPITHQLSSSLSPNNYVLRYTYFFANLMREAARCIMLWLTVPSHLLSMNIITKQFWSTDPFLAYCIIEWITKGLHIPIKLCNTFCSLKQKEGKNLNIWKYFIFVA